VETFYSGSLRIEIEEDGRTDDGRDRTKGAVILPDGRRWEFTDLASGVGGFRHGLIEAAESALAFGSYYTTHNRGDEVPDWAPPADVADEIEKEASYSPNQAIPELGIEKCGANEEETIYQGDLFWVFDGLETQQRAWKTLDEQD
jgi:hypothetical protein